MRLIMIACVGAIAALAQVDTGAVSGIVTDRSGAVVPSAKVVIVLLETNSQTELVPTCNN